MKLEVIFFFVLTSSLVTKQDSSSNFVFNKCQENATGELKNNHIPNWNERDNKCYSTKRGMTYSGTVRVTKTGLICEAWTSNKTVGVELNDCNYPERSRSKAKNYCRNPSNSDGGPWCYTSDPKTKWDYCAIDICREFEMEICQKNAIGELQNNHILNWTERDNNCYSTKQGMLYSGTVSVTKSGRTCQFWTSDTPHWIRGESLHDCNYPERSRFKAKNYCRNPDNSDTGPWCYTTDPNKRHEDCAIDKCPDLEFNKCQENAIGELKNNHIINWTERDNKCYSKKRGMTYSGTVNVTMGGYICQQWISDYPNKVKGEALKDCNYPERSRSKAKNYCRNPTNEESGPWCYINEPGIEWEFCDVNKCSS